MLQGVWAVAERSSDEQELPAPWGTHPLPAAAFYRLQPVWHEPGLLGGCQVPQEPEQR